jgi:transcriptional antiterminator RfaH
VLVIPPVSDRGLNSPPAEASHPVLNATKKAWFAVYTAPRHEKFVQTQLHERLPVMQTAGVVYVVGNGKSPLPVDDQEMHALRIGAQHASLSPHPPVSAGDTVSITRGPFRGVRGRVQQDKGNLQLVVTIQLIQKSFAINVHACDLELAG